MTDTYYDNDGVGHVLIREYVDAGGVRCREYEDGIVFTNRTIPDRPQPWHSLEMIKFLKIIKE